MQSNSSAIAAAASLPNLNLSSKNFSEELASLASLTSSSENMIENSTQASSISISCDNQNSSVLNGSEIAANDSETSAKYNIESHLRSNSTLEGSLIGNAIMPSESQTNSDHQLTSSSASSLSQQNVFESTAVSQNYLCTLLTNLENEISATQQHLDDENDKRHKYKVFIRKKYLNLNLILIKF